MDNLTPSKLKLSNRIKQRYIFWNEDKDRIRCSPTNLIKTHSDQFTLPTHLVSKLFIQLRCDSFAKINSKMPRFYPDSIFHFSEDKHVAELKHHVARRSSGSFVRRKLGPSFIFIRASRSCFGFIRVYTGQAHFVWVGEIMSRLAQYFWAKG